MSEREVYTVEVAGLERHFPLFEVAPNVRIAVVNILGDTELILNSSRMLAEMLTDVGAATIVTAEAKSIPLCYELAKQMGLPWVILRKTKKGYMGETISAETLSITTGQPQTLYLDEKDRLQVDGKNIIVVDDVISTGSTLQAIEAVIKEAGGTIVAQSAIFTEGDPEEWTDVVALGHLPVFTNEN